MPMEIHVLAADGHKIVGKLNRLTDSQPNPLNNWISNSNIDILFINKD